MIKKILVHVLMFDIDEGACNPEIMPIIVDNVLPLEDSKPIRIDHWWSGKKKVSRHLQAACYHCLHLPLSALP